MTNLKDGLGTANFNILEVGSTISGNVSSFVVGAGQISASEIGSGNVIAVNISGNQILYTKAGSGVPTYRTGSPTGYPTCGMEAGTATLGAGSTVYVAFGTAFAAAPYVVAQNTKTAAKHIVVPAGSISAGSFYAIGEAAADTFHWIAIGTRA